jgi:hypothetical protein
LSSRIVVTTLKAVLIYLIYYVVSPFVLPFLAFIPGLAETIEIFIMVYIVLMILGDITAGTIYNCFFNVGNAFFVIFYLLSLARDSVFMVSHQNFNLTADLTMLYTIAALLGLLGLAKAVMQAIIFMSERAETGIKP